ncbi:hypothetical protein [Mangrovicoccus ximenensis]|uniref:hypothetical protein n=1 Tax=Mangrovicoccus ximenensis TaxID=1911570 RepID=UPI001374E02C|nr:hypothetical protein [Mangrovicoccus ximenensis]
MTRSAGPGTLADVESRSKGIQFPIRTRLPAALRDGSDPGRLCRAAPAKDCAF